jgi:Zn-dependent M32 family carboxypeptidase
MNRIILIGNGFDLAHGKKTSYTDFINDYWNTTITNIQKNRARSTFENSEIKISRTPLYWAPTINFENLLEALEREKGSIDFKNRFLKIINRKKQIQNWVDIENEYYELLKDSFKNKNCSYKIEDLNSDFTEIQKLLEKYLQKVEENFNKNQSNILLKKSIGYKIYSDFKLKDLSESSINKKAELEFQKIHEINQDL